MQNGGRGRHAGLYEYRQCYIPNGQVLRVAADAGRVVLQRRRRARARALGGALAAALLRGVRDERRVRAGERDLLGVRRDHVRQEPEQPAGDGEERENQIDEQAAALPDVRDRPVLPVRRHATVRARRARDADTPQRVAGAQNAGHSRVRRRYGDTLSRARSIRGSLFQISLEMPQMRYLRHIVERMKNMGSQLTVAASQRGTLIIKTEGDYATVSTHFKELQVWENGEETGDISATVSAKKLAMFLGWDILHPDSVRCNLLQEKMVKLTLDVGDHIKMHYFIPAIAS